MFPDIEGKTIVWFSIYASFFVVNFILANEAMNSFGAVCYFRVQRYVPNMANHTSLNVKTLKIALEHYVNFIENYLMPSHSSLLCQ